MKQNRRGVNPRRFAGRLLLLAVALCAARAASAQSAKSPPARIATATRLVVEFSRLEQLLDSAIQRRDAAALNRLLSDDFEEWTPAPPGDPIPREEWLQHALDRRFALRSFRIGQMAVRTVDDTEVVSFVESRQAACNGRDCGSEAFVVDLWHEAAGSRRLQVRYRSEIPARAPAPAAPTPSGKE